MIMKQHNTLEYREITFACTAPAPCTPSCLYRPWPLHTFLPVLPLHSLYCPCPLRTFLPARYTDAAMAPVTGAVTTTVPPAAAAVAPRQYVQQRTEKRPPREGG